MSPIEALQAKVVTPYSLEEGEWVRRILSVWRRVAPELAPEFADYKGPARRPLGPDLTDEDVNRLRGDWHARRLEPRLTFSAGHNYWMPADLNLEIRERSTANWVAHVVSWTDGLVPLLRAYFGFVHVLTHDELQAEPQRPDVWRPWLDRRETGASIVLAPQMLAHGLPTLYWRTYFGPEYLALVGQEVLADLPAYSVELLGPFAVVQLTAEPPGSMPWLEYRIARDRVIASLGADLFRPDLNGYTATPDGPPDAWERPTRVPTELRGRYGTWPIDHPGALQS
jgi:hypothetical protein